MTIKIIPTDASNPDWDGIVHSMKNTGQAFLDMANTIEQQAQRIQALRDTVAAGWRQVEQHKAFIQQQEKTRGTDKK